MTSLPAGTASLVARNLTPEPERELPQDPIAWNRDELGGFWWSKQREIARSVVENRYTAVHAASGLGKTYLAGGIACWWIEGHQLGEARVMSSAPSDDLVGEALWYEIRRQHQRHGLVGRTNLANEWYIPGNPEEMVAMGRKPQDAVDPNKAITGFSGRHARYMLIVLDESSGIPEWLFDAADTLVTNDYSRILAIGNPDDPSSHFAKVCRPGSGWNVIGVSAFDSPNITGEWVPEYLREELPSKTWIEERKARWGVESSRYKSRVLGQFSENDDEATITAAMVRKAHQLDLPGTERGAYGLDVARFGHDKTVLYRVRGGVARLIAEWRKADTVQTTQRVIELLGEAGHPLTDVPVVVDVDGIGGGVYDQLRAEGMWVVPFTVNGPIHRPRRFRDRRSEVWWEFRKLMEAGAIDLDPADEDLASHLQQPKWEDPFGRVQVETKKEMAKRGLPSPDRADAVIYATLGAPSEDALAPGVAPRANGNGHRKPLTAGLRGRAL